MKSKEIHLNEDQLIRFVVDENDLTGTERDHLSTCPVCRGEKERFEQELTSLGRLAKSFAPLPKQKIRPFFQVSRRSWSWKPLFAVGFAAILLMIGIWWFAPFPISQEKKKATQVLLKQRRREVMNKRGVSMPVAFPKPPGEWRPPAARKIPTKKNLCSLQTAAYD